MIPSVRRRRAALRRDRRSGFRSGEDMFTPNVDESGEVDYYTLNCVPGWVNRHDWRSPRNVRKEAAAFAKWDVDHALSDCCGKGYGEHGELIYPWVAEK